MVGTHAPETHHYKPLTVERLDFQAARAAAVSLAAPEELSALPDARNGNAFTLMLSLGGDGVQLLNLGSRTATVIGLKCEDLRRDLVQKAFAVVLIMVIEGRQEPSILKHALGRLAAVSVEHAPVK